MRTARSGEVKIHIDAPPQKVWDTLANLERMGEWSPECNQVRWLDGAQSPAKVGARFKGSNKYDWLRWSIRCEVKVADPERELAWSTLRGDREMVRWRYVLEPADGGTDLTESFECIGFLSTPASLRTSSCGTGTDAVRRHADDAGADQGGVGGACSDRLAAPALISPLGTHGSAPRGREWPPRAEPRAEAG